MASILDLGATLVDVRIAPISKSPQWRKEALAALMGTAYVHLPALGNRNAFTGGPAELADPERAVAPIAALLNRGPVALLCSCADPHRCHRALAAAFLAERLDAAVIHLAAPAPAARRRRAAHAPGALTPWHQRAAAPPRSGTIPRTYVRWKFALEATVA